VPSIANDGDFSSRRILAIYGCNSGSISGVINGSRFFVLKIKWIKIDDSDCDMRVPPHIISRFQRFDFSSRRLTWAVGPGFYISHLRCFTKRADLARRNYSTVMRKVKILASGRLSRRQVIGGQGKEIIFQNYLSDAEQG
jgi:hypothetical protein